jgi:hypothetical protein
MDYHDIRLKIVLQDSGGDSISSTNEVTTTWETEMTDCNVHAWFKVFESVLAAVGFRSDVIMRGACELAFNETRDPSLMQKVAFDYDLKMVEHISNEGESETTES